MPLIGLQSEDGSSTFRWGDIDLARDWRAFLPADPALVAALIEAQGSRSTLDPDGVTASKAGTGIRQLWLEDVTDWYARPSDLLSGLLGTIRHGSALVQRDLFLTEQRFHDEIGSAQIDSFFIPLGLLSDLKTVGWYKLKMILQHGIDAEAPGYLWQMNRQKYLLQANTPHTVKRMILMVVPPDLKGRAVEEAATMGVKDLCQIDVPEMGESKTLDYYRRLRDGKLRARTEGNAPWCSKEETWSGKRCQNVRWCPVKDACLKTAQNAGIKHPYLDKG